MNKQLLNELIEGSKQLETDQLIRLKSRKFPAPSGSEIREGSTEEKLNLLSGIC